MSTLLKQFYAVVFLLSLTSYIIPNNGKEFFTDDMNVYASNVIVPAFSNCPSDITNIMPNSGNCTAVVNWTPPTATGTGPVTVTSNYNPGDSFYPGTHRVIYRATDVNGTSFCEFTVEVLDNQAPVITVPANIATTADPGLCGAVVTFPYPSANDNCPAGEGAPIDENFDSGADLSAECYDFDGTFIGTGSEVNGSIGEIETVELINNDIRSFTSPLTRFNGTGDIFFDHKIIAGSPSGNIGNGARLTVKLITTGGVETILFNELYLNENVQTEYIPITQSGNFYVQFEWETNQNRSDIAYLDDLYIPGYVISDITVVTCGIAVHRVVQIAGQPYRSGREFPVGTTTLEYLTRDAAGNIGFNSFTVTVTNNINPPAGSDVEYCEGSPIPELSVTVGAGETADWYDTAVGGTLLLADSSTYSPSGPGNYYAETRNISTGCVSGSRRRIQLIENPQPSAPIAAGPIEYCIGDTASQLTATGDPGNMIHWYDAPTGGNMYPSAPTPDTSVAGTTSYYVEQIDASTACASNRTQVEVVVYSLPLAPTVTTPVEYCIGDTASQIDTHASGTNLRWYDAATGGNEIPGTTVPNTSSAGQQLYWVTQSASSGSTNCESTRSQLTVNVNTAPTILANPSDQITCPGGTVSFTSTASNAATYQWQEFNGGSWSDLAEAAPYSNTTTTTLNINGATLSMNGNQYRLIASSAAATCSDAISNPATLTVEDNTPPVLAGCPAGPITANSTAGSCGAPVTWTPPTATDDCGSVTISSNGYSPGDEFLPGTTTVIYTATDAAGNTDACSFDIVVTDNIDPIITGPANSTVQTDNAGCTAIVNYADPIATDNCVMNTGEYPVATDFEVPNRNDLISECWIFFGSDVSNSSPLSGGRSFRTSEVEPGQTRGLVSPLMYFNGTGEISFIHRLQNFPNDVTTIRLFTEDEAGSIDPIPFFSYTYSDLNVQSANAPITFSGNYRIRFEFDTNIKRNTSKRIRMDNLTVPGIKLSDPSNGCARAEFNIIQTAGLASGSAFPVGTTTNTFEVTDAYGNTGNYSFDITVENNLTVTANATDTQVCQGDSITLTGSGAQSYSWDNGVTDGVPFTINATTTFVVTGTDANGCQDTDSITITVNANPTITVTSAPTCSTDLSTYSLSVTLSDGTLTSSEGTVTNTGGNNWTISDITSGNNVVLTTTDSNGCQGILNVTAPNCSCPTVNAPTGGGNQTECEANPIQTLTATATAPTGASVVWYDAVTGGNVVASPTLNTVGTVSYYAESVDNLNSCTSATRTSVTLTIQGAPAAPTSSGNQTECEISPAQTLTATAASPTGANLVWFDAPSGGNIVGSPTLNAVGSITYYAESQDNSTNCPSHFRTPVTLTIQPNPAAPVSGGNQTECETSPIQTLTATATAPSSSNVIWYDAASAGNIVASPTLNTVGTITYFAESQNGATSCVSNTRTPVILTIQDTPTINQTPSSTICSPDLTTYSVSVDVSTGAVTSTEGTVTDNGGNNWTISNIPAGNNITVSVTAPNSCSDSISITAPDCSCPIVAAPTSGGDQIECETSPVQTLTATTTPATDATVVWYDAASGGNLISSPTLNTVGTITYFAESRQNVTNCPSSTRTPVTLTIQATPSDPVSGGDQTVCEASPVQTLTATATAPSGSSIVWYDAASGGSVVASPTLNTVGAVTYYAESQDNTTSCAGFNRTPVRLTIQDTPDITISSAPSCSSDLSTYSVSVNVSEGTVTSTEGTVTDNGGNNWTISGVTSGNDITLTVTAPNSCLQTLALTAPDCSCPVVTAPISGGNQTACEVSPIQTLTATATPPADATVVWYDAASGGSVVASPVLNAVGTVTYYAESVQNVTNCTSSTRTAVTLNIEATPANPVSGGDQTECDANPTQTLTATASPPSGSSVVWYDAVSGGNVVTSPTLNTVGTVTYYAESRDNTTSCVSFNRTAVTLTIHPLPPVVANASSTTINAGEPVTLTGSGATSYVWDSGVTDGDTVFPLVTTTYTIIGTDGNGCDNTDSVTIIVGATSDIRLDKTVDIPNPNVGDTVVFTLTATNDGPSDDMGGSIVTDVLPNGYTYISDNGNASNGTYDEISGEWALPALTNGNSVSIDISASVNAPTGSLTEYINIAQVTTVTNFDSDSTPNNDDGDQSEDDEASVSITPQVADLEITNSISQPSANPGDALTITVDVVNNGPADVTNVEVQNIVPPGFTVTSINNSGLQTGNTISWSGLNIPNSTTTTLTFDVTVNNPTNSANEYLNTVQVTAADQFDADSTPNNDDGDQSEDDEDNILFVLQSADLEITNTVTPDSGNPRDTLTFTVDILNNGTDDATNVAIENSVPSGFTVTNINNSGMQTGNIITWNGLSIPNGTTTTVTFEATINVPTNITGEYFNAVQVVAVDQLDPDSTPNNDDGDQSEDDEDNAEIVLIPADLSLAKNLSIASNPTPNAGDTVTFELTLTNEGPGIATNVALEDTLPIGYTLETVNNGGTASGNLISWSIATMPVGTQTFSYEVTLNAPTNVADEYTNTAQIIASDQFDPDSTPNNDDGDQSEDDEVSHLINPPTVDIEINKTVNKEQTFFEDTIVFTVTATNNSTYEATTIGIEDVLPSGYTLVSTIADTGVYNETTGTWEIPSIGIGNTASLEMTVTVTDIEDYTNIAELIYVDQIDLNLDNDRAEVTPEVTQSECLTVFNEFSPNNDGRNDFFFIECIELYPENKLQVFNRWGIKVFEMNNYDNTWDGSSMGRATTGGSSRLPVGTYYYTLELGNGRRAPKSGWLYITR